MTVQTHFIKEPLLEFGNSQQLEHPQDGLFLYGPVNAGGNPEVIHIGVVGTSDGIAILARWLMTTHRKMSAYDPKRTRASDRLN